MNREQNINLRTIFRAYRLHIGATWGLVLLETIGLALIPLAMGMAIDGLLADKRSSLIWPGCLLIALTVSSVLRRIYDTRVYGAIRVRLGTILHGQMPKLNLSHQSARLDMGRELVDFLETELPELITSVVQIAVTLVILTSYDIRLFMAALWLTGVILVIYGLFHRTLYRCNAGFNSRKEQQVTVLASGRPRHLLAHLLGLKKWEVRLSDREAVMYGCIFLMVTIFILSNLLISALPDNATPGRIFTIISYSWEYAEAVIALPTTLLFFTRIQEISKRIMQQDAS